MSRADDSFRFLGDLLGHLQTGSSLLKQAWDDVPKQELMDTFQTKLQLVLAFKPTSFSMQDTKEYTNYIMMAPTDDHWLLLIKDIWNKLHTEMSDNVLKCIENIPRKFAEFTNKITQQIEWHGFLRSAKGWKRMPIPLEADLELTLCVTCKDMRSGFERRVGLPHEKFVVKVEKTTDLISKEPAEIEVKEGKGLYTSRCSSSRGRLRIMYRVIDIPQPCETPKSDHVRRFKISNGICEEIKDKNAITAAGTIPGHAPDTDNAGYSCHTEIAVAVCSFRKLEEIRHRSESIDMRKCIKLLSLKIGANKEREWLHPDKKGPGSPTDKNEFVREFVQDLLVGENSEDCENRDTRETYGTKGNLRLLYDALCERVTDPSGFEIDWMLESAPGEPARPDVRKILLLFQKKAVTCDEIINKLLVCGTHILAPVEMDSPLHTSSGFFEGDFRNLRIPRGHNRYAIKGKGRRPFIEQRQAPWRGDMKVKVNYESTIAVKVNGEDNSLKKCALWYDLLLQYKLNESEIYSGTVHVVLDLGDEIIRATLTSPESNHCFEKDKYVFELKDCGAFSIPRQNVTKGKYTRGTLNIELVK